jgi:hypothetical protein
MVHPEVSQTGISALTPIDNLERRGKREEKAE